MVTVEMLRFAAFIVLFGALWRTASAYLAKKDSDLGKAMAYVY